MSFNLQVRTVTGNDLALDLSGITLQQEKFIRFLLKDFLQEQARKHLELKSWLTSKYLFLRV
jgi:hypothetical protein